MMSLTLALMMAQNGLGHHLSQHEGARRGEPLQLRDSPKSSALKLNMANTTVLTRDWGHYMEKKNIL